MIADLVKVYKSPVMKEFLEKISKISFENLIIFIYGERGTEKEDLIKVILSYMCNPRIIKIPEQWGKKKPLSHDNPVYIVRNFENIDISFLSEKPFRCAIFVSDTDHEQLYKNNTISFELYELLSKSEKLCIPPLKERKQDIIPLADFFLQEIAEFLSLPRKELSKEAKEAILNHSWTENVSELKYYLVKAFILAKHKKLTLKDVFGQYDDRLSIRGFLELKLGNFLKDFAKIENSNLYDTVIQEVEKALFSLVLNEAEGNQVKTARILGINRKTLYKKLKHYNLI